MERQRSTSWFSWRENSLESRILGLVAAFKQSVTQLQASHPSGVESMPDTSLLTQALAEFKQESGDRWEPKLVDTLELLVIGLQQGLSLSVTSPKISGGMWLIDASTGIDAKIGAYNRVRSEV